MRNLKLLIKSLKYKIGNMLGSRGIKKKKDKSLLLYPFRMLAHPIAVFGDLKYENKASVWIANTLVLLFCLVRMVGQTSTAYLFRSADYEETSALTIGLISLFTLIAWTMCNWATCTLFDGEGSMKDIWIATSYSLLPYIIFSALNIVLSYAFTASEATFYNFFSVLGLGWTLLLIFLGVLVAHQYTVTKNVLSILGTILIIACLIFLLLLFLSIFQQIYSFISNIISELVIRNL